MNLVSCGIPFTQEVMANVHHNVNRVNLDNIIILASEQPARNGPKFGTGYYNTRLHP